MTGLLRLVFLASCFSALSPILAQEGLRHSDMDELSRLAAEKMVTVVKLQTFGYDDSIFPKYIAVLGTGAEGTRLGVIERSGAGFRWVWDKWEKDLGDEFEVGSADDFAIVRLPDGAAALAYHGCARHLCGKDGVLGVLLFVPSRKYLCVAKSIHQRTSFSDGCGLIPEYASRVFEYAGLAGSPR